MEDGMENHQLQFCDLLKRAVSEPGTLAVRLLLLSAGPLKGDSLNMFAFDYSPVGRYKLRQKKTSV